MGAEESSGSENANLYIRGVNEGRAGDLLCASELVDLLDIFGEEGFRAYLAGYLEGEEQHGADYFEYGIARRVLAILSGWYYTIYYYDPRIPRFQ